LPPPLPAGIVDREDHGAVPPQPEHETDIHHEGREEHEGKFEIRIRDRKVPLRLLWALRG
jgi:hypothetical protein